LKTSLLLIFLTFFMLQLQ